MIKFKEIYNQNKPLVNSVLMGAFYFLFSWSLDFTERTKGLFVLSMMILPGITFPMTTCYFFKEIEDRELQRTILHCFLSVGIYYGAVWLFSGEGRMMYITILAGFLGSLLFLLSTKIILKKKISLIQIAITSILSGIAFFPYTTLIYSAFSTGIALFLWTVINGFLLNVEYKKIREDVDL